MMKQKGLTLVELLFIMVILMALMSISLSVFHFAKERTRRVECMNNLRQIYLIMKMIEQDEGDMPETLWELFGISPDHPVRKQYPHRKFYTGPWWRYAADICFVCPTVRASEAWGKWFSCDDPKTIPPGTYDFPNLAWGHFVKKGLVRREPPIPPSNATLACCGGTTPTGQVVFHNIGVDFSGRIGRCYTPPEFFKALLDLDRLKGRGSLAYPIGWHLVQ